MTERFRKLLRMLWAGVWGGRGARGGSVSLTAVSIYAACGWTDGKYIFPQYLTSVRHVSVSNIQKSQRSGSTGSFYPDSIKSSHAFLKHTASWNFSLIVLASVQINLIDVLFEACFINEWIPNQSLTEYLIQCPLWLARGQTDWGTE